MVTVIVDLYGHKISTSQMLMGKGTTSPYCLAVCYTTTTPKILGCQPFCYIWIKDTSQKTATTCHENSSWQMTEAICYLWIKETTQITATTCHENSTW